MQYLVCISKSWFVLYCLIPNSVRANCWHNSIISLLLWYGWKLHFTYLKSKICLATYRFITVPLFLQILFYLFFRILAWVFYGSCNSSFLRFPLHFQILFHQCSITVTLKIPFLMFHNSSKSLFKYPWKCRSLVFYYRYKLVFHYPYRLCDVFHYPCRFCDVFHYPYRFCDVFHYTNRFCDVFH